MSAAEATYPAYVDGKPPVVTLREYDVAPWAGTTCVDRREGDYVIVVMEKPEQVVAKVSESDRTALNSVFQSAHADYAKQIHDEDVKKK